MPCVPMCMLSTLSALNSIENDYYHIEFRMDSMHIGMQAMVIPHETLLSMVIMLNMHIIFFGHLIKCNVIIFLHSSLRCSLDNLKSS